MVLPQYSTAHIPFAFNNFSGGLNSTSGPLGLNDTESSDLQNIDFNKFGSISKRNGYVALNSSATGARVVGDGIHWYELDVSGSLTRFMIHVANSKLFKMDSLDGTWDDITGALTITAGNHCDFENFINNVYITNNVDVPFVWTGSGNASAMANLPTGLTKAKFIAQYNNYIFFANIEVSGTRHASRIHWGPIKNNGSWVDTDFIEIALNDGQEITGMKVLSDRLVIYKSRSIYNVFFTGDSDIPFILPGGGKSNSQVGCAGGFTIQEVNNGHVFLSYDGVYFYDGNNSFKISDKINTTINGLADSRFNLATSLNQKNQNRYWLSVTSAGQTENDRILVWDYFNNAWSVYVGIAASAMTIAYVNGTEERPYFSDYDGFTYRADTGSSDHPSGTSTDTAIIAYYYTNWRSFGDLVSSKGVPQVYIYHQNDNTVLDFSYSYDFEGGDDFQQNFNLATSTDVYGVGVYGTAEYAGTGGDVERRDLTGRGRVIRFKFSNSVIGETFQIDGIGINAYLETNV